MVPFKNQGDPLFASEINELAIGAGVAVSPFSGNSNVGGINIGREERPRFRGKVVKTGPTGEEDDYSNSRYWILLQRIVNNSSTLTDKVAIGNFAATDLLNTTVTATNTAELHIHDSHNIAPGTFVVVTLEYSANPACRRYTFEAWPQIESGLVTAVSGCSNSVTIRPTGGAGDGSEDVTCILVFPESSDVPKKNFEVGAAMSFWRTGPTTGIAINPDINGVMFREDGSELVETMIEYNWVNSVSGRNHFDIDTFPSEDCDDNTQVQQEWRGNQVTYGSYVGGGDPPTGGAADGIAKWEFFSATEMPTHDTMLETRWDDSSFSEAYSSSVNGESRKAKFTVVGKIPVSDDHTWLSWTHDIDGAATDGKTISHLKPDDTVDSSMDAAGADAEVSCSGVTLHFATWSFDKAGHLIGPDAGGDSADKDYVIPTTSIEVVTDVVCSEGVMTVTKSTIYFVGCVYTEGG